MSRKVKNKKVKRQTSVLMKILEAVVIFGSLAALLMKFFKFTKASPTDGYSHNL